MERDPEQMEPRYLHEYADMAGKRVLEIGCGEGRLTWRYAATAGQVVAIDPDGDRLNMAVQDRPPDLLSKVLLVRGEAETLPFAGAGFERIILSWSL
jgi:ubiquinone/menaquinone biosynthesis C-methylase UbiE